MKKIEIRRPEFNATLGEGHGPYEILQEIRDLESAYVLTKMKCDHCGFGFWNVRVGNYSNPNKIAYTLEEVEVVKNV